MLLINFKVKLKIKWAKYCDLSAAGVNNINTNSNNIISNITKLYVPEVTLSARETIKNYQNFSANDLNNPFIIMNIKQKVRIKI